MSEPPKSESPRARFKDVIDLTADDEPYTCQPSTPTRSQQSPAAQRRPKISSKSADGIFLGLDSRSAPRYSKSHRLVQIQRHTGAERASKRRKIDTPQSDFQSLPASQALLSTHADCDQEDTLKTVVRKHVFHHITNCLRGHSLVVSERLSREIGRLVASELCQKDFLNELVATKGFVTAIHDAQIRIQVERLVERHIRQQPLPSDSPAVTAQEQMKRHSTTFQSALAPVKQSRRHTEQDCESSVSSNAETAGPSRAMTVSPRTSFSSNGGKHTQHLELSRTMKAQGLRIQKASSQERAPIRSQTRKKRPIIVSPESDERPYLCKADRLRLRDLKGWRTTANHTTYKAAVLHVDFSDEEVSFVAGCLFPELASVTSDHGRKVLHEQLRGASEIRLQEYTRRVLRRTAHSNPHTLSRSNVSISAFLADVSVSVGYSPNAASYIKLSCKPQSEGGRAGLTSELLLRSIYGDSFQSTSGRSLRTKIALFPEDTLARRVEWSDCSGDLSTFTWTPTGKFVCGATAHSDSHNQQYNKPGNLAFGALNSSRLQSVHGHQILRPLVETGENASHEMRETQDPWLHSSVTCTSFQHGKTFTGSFDKTVKIWSSIQLLGTWKHTGHVNFVLTSPHHLFVATSSDVGNDAIRLYDLNGMKDDHISGAPFKTYSGERADELFIARRHNQADWAYHVATMAWGQSESVKYMLLAGYSPRSYDCQDASIPEERSKTGELCLWNVRDKTRVQITAARLQNVFEVVWHPTQPIFLTATAPTGDFEDHVRTQLRLFTQSAFGTFVVTKIFDCEALDINEITLQPTSRVECYVTASCTNGKTYVWDSAHQEAPLHVLNHGEPIEPLEHDTPREICDVGVKFSAWGKTANRFYTGSSDGVLKAWDITASRGHAFVRDVLKLSGGVSAGAFSLDLTSLLIGDSSGKVHLLTTDNEHYPSDKERRHPVDNTTELRTQITAYSEEMKPEISGCVAAKTFTDLGQIVIHNRLGAIQGPNYTSTGLYLLNAHKHGVPDNPYRSTVREQQRCWEAQFLDEGILDLPRLKVPVVSSQAIHKTNCSLDLDPKELSLQTSEELIRARVDFEFYPEIESEKMEYNDDNDS